jgi:hypothetical protein
MEIFLIIIIAIAIIWYLLKVSKNNNITFDVPYKVEAPVLETPKMENANEDDAPEWLKDGDPATLSDEDVAAKKAVAKTKAVKKPVTSAKKPVTSAKKPVKKVTATPPQPLPKKRGRPSKKV